MGFRLGTLLRLSAAAFLLSGCGGLRDTLTSAATGAPPGLEDLYAEQRAVQTAAQEAAQKQAEAEAKDPNIRSKAFPPAYIPISDAERKLYGDNVALRFLTVRALEESKLISSSDAKQRRDTNLGALLPMTHGPSTLGLNSTVEPIADTRERLALLQQHYPAEATFLLEEILPLAPTRKDTLYPRDTQAVTALNHRLATLEDAGLITPAERQAEGAALGTLMRSDTLYANALALPPPEKPAAKPTRRGTGSGTAGGGRGARMPGGVSGGLVVIPSPIGVSPPRLADNATGPAGAYLLGVSSPNFAAVGWDGLQKEHPELKGLDWTLEKVDLNGEGTTYRLIAGPMDPAKARSLCQILEPRRQLCLPMAFPKNGTKPAAPAAPITAPTSPSAAPPASDALSISPTTKTAPTPPAPVSQTLTSPAPAAPAPTAPATPADPAASTPPAAMPSPVSGTPSLSAPLPAKSEDTPKNGAGSGLIAPPPAAAPTP